jgi:hypothetical protein
MSDENQVLNEYQITNVLYRQVLLYTRVMFLKKLHESDTEFLFKTVDFLEVRGLITSSYIRYDYTTSRHMDLQSMYIKYIYISIQYTHYICSVYLFISNAVKM